MKMAAAEGLHDGGNGVPFTIVGDLKIHKMLSILDVYKRQPVTVHTRKESNTLQGWINTGQCAIALIIKLAPQPIILSLIHIYISPYHPYARR